MKPYWNEMMTPMPGLAIHEVELKFDNVYIKDQLGRVWQITIQPDHPEIRLIANEDH